MDEVDEVDEVVGDEVVDVDETLAFTAGFVLVEVVFPVFLVVFPL